MTTRRGFLGTAGAIGAGYWINGCAAPAREGRSKSPNERLNVACVGTGGQGGSDMGNVGKTENIVALCDIDKQRNAEALKKHPNAKIFDDYRVMLEEMDAQIDAVTVGTPDHHHAPATAMAIRMGKHVYTQKPMTHSVHEARVLRELAKKHKVATQMGNQGTAGGNLRQSIEIVQSGAIGDVKEVHIWTNRPVWPQSPHIKARPSKAEEVPANINWDVWLGPAPERPYSRVYLHFKWRGWWDFGTGALGDMACHTANLPYFALKLGAPTSVQAESEEPNPETCPAWAKVAYEFPARGSMPPVKVVWYEGKKPDGERVLPPLDLLQGEKVSDSGSLLVGSKGTMYSPDDYGGRSVWLPKDQYKDYKPPAPTLPRSPGHHAEWIAACKGGPAAMSNFEHAGPFTEFVLLGNVAIRAQEKIVWDPENLKAKGCPKADQYIKREYRKGWSL